MNLKSFFSFILILWCSLGAMAQKYAVSGSIIAADTRETLPQVNVQLLAKDSTRVTATNTNDKGGFQLHAKAAGEYIYHLNIGQPDVETPKAFFDAVKNFEQPVLEYAPSPGIPVLIDAIQKYYDNLGMHFEKDEIQITTGGSEALQIVMNFKAIDSLEECLAGKFSKYLVDF